VGNLENGRARAHGDAGPTHRVESQGPDPAGHSELRSILGRRRVWARPGCPRCDLADLLAGAFQLRVPIRLVLGSAGIWAGASPARWACAGQAGVPRACDGVCTHVCLAGAVRPRPGAAGLKATRAGGDPQRAELCAARRVPRPQREPPAERSGDSPRHAPLDLELTGCYDVLAWGPGACLGTAAGADAGAGRVAAGKGRP
jgi:hypothetical protein